MGIRRCVDQPRAEDAEDAAAKNHKWPNVLFANTEITQGVGMSGSLQILRVSKSRISECLDSLAQDHTQTAQQLLARSLLRVHAWHFFYPADPPVAILFEYRGI
jgi:hypothetical protein